MFDWSGNYDLRDGRRGGKKKGRSGSSASRFTHALQREERMEVRERQEIFSSKTACD